MTLLWGAVLAAGLLLTLSPWLWPAREARAVRPIDRPTRAPSRGGGARPSVARCRGGDRRRHSRSAAGAVTFLVIPVPALAGVAFAAGALAPFVWLRARHSRIMRARRALWPDVCDLLIASVRAGMSLPDAVSALGESAPSALRPAFVGFARDLAASGHFDSSAQRLKAALADPVGDRIIETLRMARQVGGTELTPVLRALATSVRADATLRSEVEARQSWIRGAAVLGVAAPWVILTMLALRPEGAKAYASPAGIALILAGAAVSFVAYRVMLRIGRLREPRRWFA